MMFRSQKEIFDKLVKDIRPFHANKVIALSGKSGVGKSFVVNSLKDKIQEQYSAPICHIKGDQFCQTRDYFCIKRTLNDMTKDYATKKTLTDSVSKSVQDIPYAGTLGERILSGLFDYTEIKQKQRNYFLDIEEQEIIYRLNYLFDKRCSLIICDNIQYFDMKSLELLYLLLSSGEETFDFLPHCQFLLVYTEIDEEIPPIVKNLLDKKATIKYTLHPVEFDEMESVLYKFECKIALDKEIKRVLYKLADGHLEVIKHIVLQMNNITPKFLCTSESTDAKKVLDELITNKFKNLGASGDQISQVLEYASLIGRTFSNDELAKIVELNYQDFRDAIQKSNEMELINSSQKYSNFSHDIIQLLFRNRANKNICYYYERMKACIKELYPAEYKQRIEMESLLGNTHEAAKLIALYCAQKNYMLSEEDNSYVQILSLNITIKEFLDDMKKAYEAYKNEDYKTTILILNSIDSFLPSELLAEKDILKSISLTKLLSESCRQEAISCLAEYTFDSLNREGDLYLRVLLARISAYSHMGRNEDAKKSEKEICQYLYPRQYYDDNANNLINILRRKANSMHECNYAERYIKKSVEYFAPLARQSAPLNPIQYLMSLGNHAGILIECARFDEAYEEIVKAQLLVQNNEIVFPRLHIIDNNYLLSMYLSDSSKKKDILEGYKKLLSVSQNADNVFIVSNYCALLAVNGKTLEAYQLLEEKKLQLTQNSEHIYDICICNNLLVLKLFYKEFSEAQVLLYELQKHTQGIIDESYYQKKYEIFQQIIDLQMDISFEKLDVFLFDFCKEYQEAWNYWGRSFDYSTLYYWSDM